MDTIPSRALLAYTRSHPDGPEAAEAVATWLDGLEYAVVTDRNRQILHVYRVKANRAHLRSLSRLPVGLPALVDAALTRARGGDPQ